MQKKGVIELHFNWIFVLIAGAVIFFFFINIVNRQKEFSEIKISSTIINNLESILTGAQVSTNTVNIIDVPKVKIGVECDKFFIGSVPKQTKSNIIFSPNLLKGKKIITWTLEWSLPYRIVNFLYITDPEVRYIIVNNSENLGRKIYDELPKELNKELVSSASEVKDKNNYKVKFVFLGNSNVNDVLSNFNEMSDEDVTAINLTDIETLNVIPNTGTVKFLKNEGVEWKEEDETYYLKKESLFGAIFAEDLETYNCLMRKAFKRLNLVTNVYLNRSLTLVDYYGNSNLGCSNAHFTAKERLKNMEGYSEDMVKNFPDNVNIGYINNIQNTAIQIGGAQNSANSVAQLWSCALIY